MISVVATTLHRRYRFCASHRLHSPTLTAAVNQQIYGKCNNPYGHGHDYMLDVSVTGELNTATGLIVKLQDLDNLVHTVILTHLDHRNLNVDLPEFECLIPTTENLAIVIAGRLQSCWKDTFPDSLAWLSGVAIQETDRNSVAVLIRKAATVVSERMQESVIVNA